MSAVAEMLMTHANAPAAPALPTMPPSGRITAIVAEIGLAMGGSRSPAYCAFAWRFARDEVVLPKLRRHLYGETLRIAGRMKWPDKMRGKTYLEKLVWLAVWEEQNWWWVRQGKAWARLIQMDDELWEHRVAEKYNSVREILDRWCAEARQQAFDNIYGIESTISTR